MRITVILKNGEEHEFSDVRSVVYEEFYIYVNLNVDMMSKTVFCREAVSYVSQDLSGVPATTFGTRS